jgi:uncharacterized protein YodC (DUF2158 family)
MEIKSAVILNSGSPIMEVIDVLDGICLCKWYDDETKNYFHRLFPEVCLKVVGEFPETGPVITIKLPEGVTKEIAEEFVRDIVNRIKK